jgi:hypothetical protein
MKLAVNSPGEIVNRCFLWVWLSVFRSGRVLKWEMGGID